MPFISALSKWLVEVNGMHQFNPNFGSRYAYSVVEYQNGVGRTLFNTDSLAHARQEVLKIIRNEQKTVFILRNT